MKSKPLNALRLVNRLKGQAAKYWSGQPIRFKWKTVLLICCSESLRNLFRSFGLRRLSC